MKNISTTFRIAGACLAAAVVTLLGVAPAAHAAVDQACAASTVVTYSPPLTNTPQTVTTTINSQYFNCTSSSAPTGTYTDTVTVPNAMCTVIFEAGSGTKVINWTNTAIASSTFTYNRTSSRVGGTVQVELVGSISSGTFNPDPAKEEATGPQPDPTACATTGVSQIAFLGTLTIGV
jgi:hypothetical protein